MASDSSASAAGEVRTAGWKPLLAALLSAIVAGAGQWYARRWWRGLAFFLPIVALVAAASLLVDRGLFALLELLVQPRVLWTLLAINVALILLRGYAVVDAFRLKGGASTSAWAKAGVGVMVLAVAAPHVVAISYTVDAITLIEDVTTSEGELPSAAEREAELLAAGVPEAELGPLPEPVPNPTTNTFTPQESTINARDLIPEEDLNPVRPTIVPREASSADAPFLPVDERMGQDRITVLLAGGDAGPGRSGLRTDTMMVVTMDLNTGKGAIFSLARNLSRVPLPPRFANAFREMEIQYARMEWEKNRPPHQVPEAGGGAEQGGGGEEGAGQAEEPAPQPKPQGPPIPKACKCFVNQLNAIYPFTRNWVRTFPKEVDPGMAALRETVEHLLKLKIDYYVLVDMAGFVDLVDAVGGVDVYVERPMHIAFSAPEEGGEKALINVGVGENHLDGLEALAYVRSRYGSSDYTRMRRQRCMLRSVADKATPSTLLSSFPQIADAIRNSATTDIPVTFLPEFVEAAAKLRVEDIETVAFQPSYYAPTKNFLGRPIPNVKRIRAKVRDVLGNTSNPDSLVAAGDAECTPRTPRN